MPRIGMVNSYFVFGVDARQLIHRNVSKNLIWGVVTRRRKQCRRRIKFLLSEKFVLFHACLEEIKVGVAILMVSTAHIDNALIN